jgi:hypothetical protein
MHRVLPFVWIVLATSSSALAQADSLSADEIARRTLRADAFSWEGARTRLKMVLIDKDGKRKERAMEVVARRQNGLLSSLMRFSAPEDLAGTAFLMREQAGGASEQYVYLSGLKRTRRIVGREREGSFVGSDFTYADMQRVDPKHTHNVRLPDEDIGKESTYVIESTIAKEAGSPYAKVVT